MRSSPSFTLNTRRVPCKHGKHGLIIECNGADIKDGSRFAHRRTNVDDCQRFEAKEVKLDESHFFGCFISNA